MWDALFAIDSTLELVDMISIAMLLRIRWDLIEADTNEAFGLLLRYPETVAPAYTFIKDALYLRDHLTPEGGAEIVSRYGKPAPVVETQQPSIREPSPTPSYTSSRTRNSIGSPRSVLPQQGAGIEALLQGAAKNVIERGSQWGVGRAIRGAVGEVRKNVEAIQSGAQSGQTTPRSGGREFRKPAQITTGPISGRPSLDRMHSSNAMKKIESLESRSRNLAKMLESAVAELWDHHKERSEDSSDNKESVAALSLAIAKVQFVQVYLEDSSIPLPIDETTEQEATADAAASLLSPPSTSPAIPERTSSAPPVASTPQSRPASSAADLRPTSPLATTQTPAPTLSSHLSPRARPTLASSSFSWMLGQESTASTFASSTAHTAFASDEKRRMKGKGFLFGDDEDADSPVNERRGSTGTRGGKGGKAKGKGKAGEAEVEEEIIDLEDVGKRGAVS
jgi:TBC1 domain family protein 5